MSTQTQAWQGMGFAQARQLADELWEAHRKASQAMDAYPKNAMGLTPDEVKRTDEWKRARAAADASFAQLRRFNAWFLKAFKPELQRERRARHEAREQGTTKATNSAEKEPETT